MSVREVARVVLVERHGTAGQLVDPALKDGARQLFEVVAIADEITRQSVEQFRVRRRVGDAEIVDRLDETAAQKVAPDAVDGYLREGKVIAADQPVGED